MAFSSQSSIHSENENVVANRGKGFARQSRLLESGYSLDRLPAAHFHIPASRAERISNAAKPELSLEFRLAGRHRAPDHDRERNRARNALRADRRWRIQV